MSLVNEFSSSWLFEPVRHPDRVAELAAHTHQNTLTKPPGALGRLEEIAIRLAGLQGRVHPQIQKVRIAIFVGDHGVAEEGVSAFPQAVTVEMVRNFARGGAAISVLARELNASLEVVNVGTVGDSDTFDNVLDRRVAAGTKNFCTNPAMSEEQLQSALAAGREAADRTHAAGAELFIGGEMGIANTTAAAAIACALLDLPGATLAGPGTGVDTDGVQRKAQVIDRALTCHRQLFTDPLTVLRCVGGFEIAALTGAFLRCAQFGVPVLVDGFIATVAALVTLRHAPDAGAWFFYAHRSAEPGHRQIMKALAAEPLLDLGMRLGEGSGAALAVPVLRLACSLHANMATFTAAGVSEKIA